MENANGARWKEKVWFQKIGDEGINSFLNDRTRAISYIAKSGTGGQKQTLSDARESTNWRVLCQGLRMVITEVQPKIGTEKPPEVERSRFYVLSADVEAYGHVGS